MKRTIWFAACLALGFALWAEDPVVALRLSHGTDYIRFSRRSPDGSMMAYSPARRLQPAKGKTERSAVLGGAKHSERSEP